jgi:hypothetical protein
MGVNEGGVKTDPLDNTFDYVAGYSLVWMRLKPINKYNPDHNINMFIRWKMFNMLNCNDHNMKNTDNLVALLANITSRHFPGRFLLYVMNHLHSNAFMFMLHLSLTNCGIYYTTRDKTTSSFAGHHVVSILFYLLPIRTTYINMENCCIFISNYNENWILHSFRFEADISGAPEPKTKTPVCRPITFRQHHLYPHLIIM